MKQKNILIDLDRLKDPYNGLGQVALNMGEALSKIEDDSIHFTYLVSANFVNYFGNKVSYEVVSARRRYLPFTCKPYDLWYTIHQDSWYFPSGKKTPYVLTINDLNFLGEKTGYRKVQRLKRLQHKVDRASVITTISRYTAGEVKKHLHITDQLMEVIYCGVTVHSFEHAKRPAYVPEGEVLFTVGVIQPKKNFGVLIDFMALMPANYVLVIAGNKSGNHSAELESRILEAGLEGRIILPGLISDEDKYWFYTNCEAVVFPSKFEGMGFPPVEAMRCGKPVFASTYSSIPEVSGDKAYYWDSFDPAYMVSVYLDNIQKFKSTPGRAEELKLHSMKYTWENAAREYISLFRQILGMSPV
jgi:glycosyltransferase involved in cell wall biosynthesis